MWISFLIGLFGILFAIGLVFGLIADFFYRPPKEK